MNRISASVGSLMMMGFLSAACTQVELVSNQDLFEGNTLTSGVVGLKGDYCTPNGSEIEWTLKVTLMIDTSGSQAANDPQCLRVGAAKGLVDSLLASNPKASIQIVRFNDTHRPLTNGFTRDLNELDGAIYGKINGQILYPSTIQSLLGVSSICNLILSDLQTLGLEPSSGGGEYDNHGGLQMSTADTNFIPPLVYLYTKIVSDANETTEETRLTTQYLSVLVTDGLNGVDESDELVLQRVDLIRNLKDSLDIGEVTLNTGLLQYLPPGTPLSGTALDAYLMLEQMAVQGGGIIKYFNQTETLLNFSQFNLGATFVRYIPKFVTAVSVNYLTQQDTDNDNLSDSVEIALGLNPESGSSDGNGDDCSDWFEVESQLERLPFLDQSRLFASVGSSLSYSQFAEEYQRFVETILPKYQVDPKVADCNCDRYFRQLIEDEIVDSGYESDFMTLCRIPSKGSPQLIRTVDTDGDLLSDYEELLAWGSDPFEPDTDGDNLTDGIESRLGRSPIVDDSGCLEAELGIDTDGDGVLNCAERLLGTSIGVVDSDADGALDLLELKFETIANEADLVQDPDFDSINNGLEIQRGLNSRVQNSSTTPLSYRYEIGTYKSQTNGSTCFSLSIQNISVVETGHFPRLFRPWLVSEAAYRAHMEEIRGRNSLLMLITQTREGHPEEVGLTTGFRRDVIYRNGAIFGLNDAKDAGQITIANGAFAPISDIPLIFDYGYTDGF